MSDHRERTALAPAHRFEAFEIGRRERCPFAVVGHASEEERLIVADSRRDLPVIDLPMDGLF
ncbi:MAG TPA: hypothetical protein VM555_00050, partial [Tahibacter sp.]|nr:hypothetical protein [Tahibacter sp.]